MPVGALLLGPLSLLPLGAWVIESGAFTPGICGFKQFLGIPCLTCGATRATVHLFHLELWEAVRFQPLIIMLYLALFAWSIVSLWALATRHSVRMELTEREDLVLKIGLVSLPLLNWIYLWMAGI